MPSSRCARSQKYVCCAAAAFHAPPQSQMRSFVLGAAKSSGAATATRSEGSFKPDRVFRFVEDDLASEPLVRRWQRWLI